MIYVSTKPNVFRDGYEEVAEKISARCRNYGGRLPNGSLARYCVWVAWDGLVTIRPRFSNRARPLPDSDLVGMYDQNAQVEQIESDLIERMRELTATGKQAA